MKKYIFLLFLGLTFGLNQVKAQTILSIDGQSISKKDFVEIYKKNNKESNPSEEDLDEYMELFINYKLKVLEAEKLKMDTIPSFVKELEGYRNQLAAPYLIDKDKTGALITEAYDRMKTEVRASHILIGFDKRAKANDTLTAYNKVMEVRAEIMKGEKSFEELATEYSTDPSVKTNKGDLGYFKSLQMVYPFESAAYNTKVGEISKPVRTRFGYHLLKVVDKRPSLGEIKVAHILIMANKKNSDEEKKVAEKRINEIYQELEDGKSFSSLAIKYSDDKSSSRSGGELPQFGSGKMVKEFEDVAFGLKTDEEYSKPFKTSYGWHIVKRIERIPLPPKEEMEKELQDRISKDSRANITKQSFLSKLKSEYGFKENLKALKTVKAMVDSSILVGRWNPSEVTMTKELFRLNGKKYTQDQFIKYLRFTQGRSDNIDLDTYVSRKYKSFVDAELMGYEKTQLENKYPKFKSLMKEYRDGILLFNLTEDKIWGRAAKDTVGLMNYYDNHKNEFMYEERVNATILQCKSKEIADKVDKAVKAGKSSKEINEEFNKESQLNVIIESGTYEKDDEEILENVPFKVGVSDIKELNNQYVMVNITEVLASGVRPYDESKGLVTAAYQRYLEENWIEELRDGHDIKINKEVLYSVK